MAKAVDKILEEIRAGRPGAVYLVYGDLVLARPQAARIAEALAALTGGSVVERRRPTGLGAIFADLRTYSLFSGSKVILVVDAAIFADRKAAADLVDQAEEGLPVPDAVGELPTAVREAASRLLQALRLFEIVPRETGAAQALEALPDWAFEGGVKRKKRGKRARSAKARKKLREELLPLLEAALGAGLEGFAESDLAELGEIVENGLPEGHALVLAEQSADPGHPVVASLDRRGAAVELAHVEAAKGGRWQGLGDLVKQLEKDTGAGIAPNALDELARRTLRQGSDWKDPSADSGSTARFAAEYRKLAAMAGGGAIDRALVERTVQDRGEEDVWKILDALGGGREREALDRYRRYVAAADDATSARLSFFNLLAGFCRQLTAISGMMKIARVQPGERNYQRFKSRLAPALQGELPTGEKSPLAGLHPYRLHRAYLAASGIPESELARMPWRILETEMRLKGESSDPDAALTQLMARVTAMRRGLTARR